MTQGATRFGLITLAVALAAAVAGIWAARQFSAAPPPTAPAAPQFQALKHLPEPRVVADFALIDQAGEPFNLARWQGRWNLVFFGFTHCPDICPGTLHLLSGVTRSLAVDPDELAVTFISVDPERDKPEQLAAYASFYGPHTLGVTGPEPQLVALGYQLGLVFDIEPHEPGDTVYAVDHSAAIVVIGPNGRYHGQFQPPHEPTAMVADLRTLLAQSGSNARE